jgi:N utilization substance protein A
LVELFKQESSEIAQGIVEILAVAREPGSRSKIAVKTNDDRIDPVGACVGQRGSRVSAITQELSGEKIDIIEWNDDIRKFIAASLSPAKPISIEIDEAEKKATVTVLAEEQSLAIGKGGQNVRLAAKLTAWKIDIVASGETLVEASTDGVVSETGKDDETIDEEVAEIIDELQVTDDQTIAKVADEESIVTPNDETQTTQ